MEDNGLPNYEKVVQQVNRWDLLAKIIPLCFLTGSFIALMFFDSVTFHHVFVVGLITFVITAVTWWFWAIFSIRFLIRLLRKTDDNFYGLYKEFKEIHQELKDLKHDSK